MKILKITAILTLGLIASMCHGQIVNPGGGGGTGTVTHTSGALTPGGNVIGNGGGDVTIGTCDDSITAADQYTCANIQAGNLGVDDASPMNVLGSSAAGTVFTVGNGSGSSPTVAYGIGVTGSNTNPGVQMFDETTGSIPFALYSLDGSHYKLATNNTGVIGFSSGADPTNSADDTGFSRTGANAVAVGNGTQGDASGSIAAATAKLGAPQTTVNCATSGTAIFSEPEQGSSSKMVMIKLTACLGNAVYTYPVAFSAAPSPIAALSTTVSVVSPTAVTITGATSTGFLELIGF